jgi:hypothetical protein
MRSNSSSNWKPWVTERVEKGADGAADIIAKEGLEQALFRYYNNRGGWSTFGSPIIFGDFKGREESNPSPLPDRPRHRGLVRLSRSTIFLGSSQDWIFEALFPTKFGREDKTAQGMSTDIP